MSVAKRLIGKTILHKIYINDKNASCFYASLPVTPNGPSMTSEWRRASRPQIPAYVKGILHYEVAILADKDRIMQFLLQKIIPSSPLFDSLGANPNELVDLYEPIVEKSLQSHCSLLGFNGDELIAVSLNSIESVSSNSNHKPNTVDIIPGKDYASEIDSNGKYKSRSANKVACFAKILRNNFEDLLPNGSHKVCFIEIGGVAEQYRGRGISQEMVKHSMTIALEQFKCDYVVTMVDSKPAQKLFEQKLGYTLLREFKLDHYLDGTNPVFFCEMNDSVSGKLVCKHL